MNFYHDLMNPVNLLSQSISDDCNFLSLSQSDLGVPFDFECEKNYCIMLPKYVSICISISCLWLLIRIWMLLFLLKDYILFFSQEKKKEKGIYVWQSLSHVPWYSWINLWVPPARIGARKLWTHTHPKLYWFLGFPKIAIIVLVRTRTCSFPQTVPIVRTQLGFNGVDLDLGSQIICIVGLKFPTMGDLMLRDLGTLSWFYTPLFLSHDAAPFFSLSWVSSFFQFSLQNCQPPLLL